MSAIAQPSDESKAPPDLPGRNGGSAARPYLLFALMAALIVHATGVLLLRPRFPATKPSQQPSQLIRYAAGPQIGESNAFDESGSLYDPEPVFLPTRRNYTSVREQPPPPGMHPLFEVYGVDAAPKDRDFRLPQGSSAEKYAPSDSLRVAGWDYSGTFGQAQPAATMVIESRGARVKIVRLDPGIENGGQLPAAVIAEESWPVDMAPPAGSAQWAPLRFSLLFNAAGPVGAPLLLGSSGLSVPAEDGKPSVDNYFRQKLDEWSRSHPLPPGSYEVTIAP